jgi:aspartoacylase
MMDSTPPKPMSANSIQRVAIVGGTHGNELTGVYLVKKFEKSPNLVHRSSFATELLIANPRSVEVCRRYIETDLNRCFSRSGLDQEAQTYEEQRAQEIDRLLQTETPSESLCILDLHTSTSNMEMTLILGNLHPFNVRLAAYLSTINPRVKIYKWIDSESSQSALRSLSPLGLSIEVGPVPQGVLDADLYQETEYLIYAALDFIERSNRGEPPTCPSTITLYQGVEIVEFPRDEQGQLTGMIFPDLQYQDYNLLNPGDPMFVTFEGETIAYEGDVTVFPVFINEAAYYEKNIAMCLTRPEILAVEPAA